MLAAGLLLGVPLIRKGVALVQTVPARYGRVSVTREGEALVIRAEQVVFAEVRGKVEPVAREGERVPRGALVARVISGPDLGLARSGQRAEAALRETERRAILDEQSALARGEGRRGASGEAIAAERRQRSAERVALARGTASQEQYARTPTSGTVSYTVDGLEGILGPKALKEVMSGAASVTQVARGAQSVTVKAGETVEPGRPVAKVVDNFRVWFLVELPKAGAEGAPAAGERVRLRLVGAGLPAGAVCSALVVERRDVKDRIRLLLEPVEYWPEFGRVRVVTVQLLLGEYEGVVIPRRAVVQRRSGAGVTVESWLGKEFQPVSVRGGDPERVVVDGLAPGTRVWREP